MKAGIFVALSVALVAGCVSVRADDTPAQAAALAALEQKMQELDHSQTQPPPDTNSAAAVAKPVESATNATNATRAVSATAAVPRPAPAETIPAAAPAAEVPAVVAHTKAASASAAPAGTAFAQKIPADNVSAQTAALAALEQQMRALNRPEARPATETPTAEVPAAKSPGIAPSGVAPLSAAPAVVAPAPEASPAPAAAASVAVVPEATAGPDAVTTGTPQGAAPAMSRPDLEFHAATLPSSSPRQARPTNELVTTAGVIYKNVEVERVTADGILISYTPAKGGWAMTKVYFQDLPAEMRQQYGK